MILAVSFIVSALIVRSISLVTQEANINSKNRQTRGLDLALDMESRKVTVVYNSLTNNLDLSEPRDLDDLGDLDDLDARKEENKDVVPSYFLPPQDGDRGDDDVTSYLIYR